MTSRVDQFIAVVLPDGLQPHWKRFRASDLSVRLARGVFWSLVGAIISRGMGVVGSIFVARRLGIAAFGEFTVIQSTVGLFGTFAGLGLGITATKYVAELRGTDPVRCGRIIGLILMVASFGGVVAGIALYYFSSWIATNTLAAPALAPMLQCSASLVLFSTLQGVYSGVLGGFEAFKRVAQVNWIGAVIGTILLIGCTMAAGFKGAVWGSILQIAVGCGIGHFALLKEAAGAGVKLSWALDVSDCRILWRFSLPAFLSSTLVGPVNWVCNTFLANQDQGYKEVALLNAANQWKNILGFLPLMMTSVLVPIFSSLHRAGKGSEFRNLLRQNLLTNAGICLVLALPLAAFAPFIMTWYGPEFRRGVPVFLWMLLGTVIVAVNNLLSRAMQASGRAWTDLTFSGLWAIVLLTGCFLLVPAHKAVGVIIAHFLAAVALGIWQWHVVKRLFAEDATAISADVASESAPAK